MLFRWHKEHLPQPLTFLFGQLHSEVLGRHIFGARQEEDTVQPITPSVVEQIGFNACWNKELHIPWELGGFSVRGYDKGLILGGLAKFGWGKMFFILPKLRLV